MVASEQINVQKGDELFERVFHFFSKVSKTPQIIIAL
jgi:hypothetical protein